MNKTMKALLAILIIAFSTILHAAELEFTWDENDPAENVVKYVLYQEAPGEPILWNPVAEVATPPAVISNVPSGNYKFHLTAINIDGLESLPSAVVDVEVPTLPGVPMNLKVTIQFKGNMTIE